MSNLFINDLFWTIQGEGHYAGRRALFVRMPYCNLACSWCDTTFNSYKKFSQEEFKAFADQELSKFAVVTGGEPLLHAHTPVVVSILKELGFTVACETNGTQPYVAGIDFVTCSPKRDAEYAIHKDIYHNVSEFKYVVDDGFDFSILDRHCNDSAFLSLSPEFSTFAVSVSKIVDYIKENPRWRMSLQTHKWAGLP